MPCNTKGGKAPVQKKIIYLVGGCYIGLPEPEFAALEQKISASSVRHSSGLLLWKVTWAFELIDLDQIDMGTEERAEDKRAENGALLLENEDEFEEFEVDGAS